jgi:hypothetical protein
MRPNRRIQWRDSAHMQLLRHHAVEQKIVSGALSAVHTRRDQHVVDISVSTGYFTIHFRE